MAELAPFVFRSRLFVGAEHELGRIEAPRRAKPGSAAD
jgi:hypothetical protein